MRIYPKKTDISIDALSEQLNPEADNNIEKMPNKFNVV